MKFDAPSESELFQVKILHVVESFGGGVASAVFDYATSSSDLEHYLVRAERQGSEVTDHRESSLFIRVENLGASRAKAIKNVRDLIHSINPDVVHAHSSLAGLIVRMAALSIRSRPKIVYTPHCFSFERRDVSKLTLSAFWLAERLMTSLTDVYAVCSEREGDLALRLKKRARVVVIPNTSLALDISSKSSKRESIQPGSHCQILGSGRLARQKDPEFFADVVNRVKEDHDVVATWVGGGDDSMEMFISSQGIRLTGWVDRTSLLEIATSSDIYVHTAAWEGMPIAFLEFHRLGLPMVVRQVESMPWIPDTIGSESIDGLAAIVSTLVNSESARAENVMIWADLLSKNTMERQRAALRMSYLGDSTSSLEAEANSFGF